MEAVKEWLRMWPEIEKKIKGCPLLEAHELIVTRAAGILPYLVEEK